MGLGTVACGARTSLFEFQKIAEEAGIERLNWPFYCSLFRVFWAFAEWRLGLLLCLATAILQDPLRKLTPDQPVFFIGFVGDCLCSRFHRSSGPRCANVTVQNVRRLSAARETNMDIAAIDHSASVQFLRTVWQSRNFTDWIAHVFVAVTRNCLRVSTCCSRRFDAYLSIYEGLRRLHGLALTTVYLEYAGYDWPVFGQVGGNLIMYDKYVGVIIPHSGIFRASEIAAWHAMACACFIVLLMTLRKINFSSLLIAMVTVGLLVGIGVLTGRRKMLVEVVVFIGAYSILWIILQKGVAKLGVILTIAGVIGCACLVGQLNEREYTGDER